MQQSEEARMAGLSPLARVTLAHLTDDNARLRFIPAGVGEHGSMVADNRSTFGLSPLARGTRADCRSNRWYLRFIPAGAGNTATSLLSGW